MEMNHEERSNISQILLKLLDGTHRFLNFTTPTISIQTLQHKIQTLTSIPSHHQLLLLLDPQTHHSPTLLHDAHQTLDLNAVSGTHKAQDGKFPAVVHLLLRLRGGKGGFGSLLRGAATKAGQKKTNNFDACRDMSGRRLRHVNAEKRLEEWRAETEERKLEKMAEDFIKKKAKEMVKKGKGKGGVDTDKYVQKYREDSAKCMEEVERSVRDSLKGLVASKRKGGASEGNASSDAKRFKIWFGKRKLDDSDSENDSDEDGDENNKSVVIDNADHSDSSKEAEGSSDSVTEALHDIVAADVGTSESGSEEEKDSVVEESQGSGESEVVHVEAATVTELELGTSAEKTFQDGDKSSLQTSVVMSGAVQEEQGASDKSCFSDVGGSGSVNQALNLCTSGEDKASIVGISTNPISNLAAIQNEVVTTSAEAPNVEKPLTFEEINSASELEVLGMERLKSELQARGLKCGGTLQERAARLFLLKTTPVEMLPKKLLAKK